MYAKRSETEKFAFESGLCQKEIVFRKPSRKFANLSFALGDFSAVVTDRMSQEKLDQPGPQIKRTAPDAVLQKYSLELLACIDEMR